jgi:hypothetical protein
MNDFVSYWSNELSKSVKRKFWEYELKRKNMGTIQISFIFAEATICSFDVEGMTKQMKMWRQEAKEGNLKIHDCKSAYLPNKKKCWYFVMDIRDPITNKSKITRPDILGTYLFDQRIEGLVMVFKSKRNRDAIQKYVMRGI